MYDWMDFEDHGSSGNFMNNNVDKATEKYGPCYPLISRDN
jgi:hypothetical protein